MLPADQEPGPDQGKDRRLENQEDISEAELEERLKSLASRRPGNRKQGCPPESVWLSAAGGVLPPSEAVIHLEHAATCDYCGSLLKRVLADFEDEENAEEAAAVAALSSANPDWHKKLGKRLAIRPERGFETRWAIAAAALAVICAGLLWELRRDRAVNVDHLLERAYTENRVMDFRIAGAAHTEVRTTRGAGGTDDNLERPEPLLQAEAEIAARLRKSPDDLTTLTQKARAAIVEGGRYQFAITTLESALAEKPADESIEADLAAAYFQRAEALNRPIDYAKSAELLSAILEKKKNDALALFNRAIVLDRAMFYQQALADWNRYLTLDPSGPWSAEARTRRDELKKKIEERNKRSSAPLLTAAGFAQAASSASFLNAADARIERYFEAALSTWLPAAFPESAASSNEARAGLEALSKLMDTRHGDRWLGDFLALAGSQASNRGLALLIRAHHGNQVGEFDSAIERAGESVAVFQKAGNAPGVLQAQWERIYALRLSLRASQCLPLVRAQWQAVSQTRYQWLRIRTLLESASCATATGDKQSDREFTVRGLQESEEHSYPELHEREVMYMADVLRETADDSQAFTEAIGGLHQFWSGAGSALPGYNLYTALDSIADSSQMWRFQTLAIRESLGVLGDYSDTLMLASERRKLSLALVRSGDLAGAAANLIEVRKMLDSLPPTGAVKNRLADVETGLADIQYSQGDIGGALDRLKRIEPSLIRTSNSDLNQYFYSRYGDALRDAGQPSEARKAYLEVVRIAETALGGLAGEQERLLWSRRSGPAYRGLVRLELQGNPAGAFRWWEWYRSASLRRGQAKAGGDPARLPDATGLLDGSTRVVSYASFPDGIAVWVWSVQGIDWRWISVPSGDIDRDIRQFAALCSRDTSSLSQTRSEGARLYSVLLKPIEPLLPARGSLIVELDGYLERIPFEALVNSSGRYVAEDFQVAISPGIQYLAAAARPVPFDSRTRTLIVADGEAHPELLLGPLPNAETESRVVAASFDSPLLRTGPNAAILSSDLRRAELFHFAGHAISGVNGTRLVAGAERGTPWSPPDWRNVRLAVLSACASAQGSDGGFTDAGSMARSLISTGVSQVVASRWPVNSSSTLALMRRFYSHLTAREPVLMALASASHEMRATPGFEHPFHWAAFTVYGRS